MAAINNAEVQRSLPDCTCAGLCDGQTNGPGAWWGATRNERRGMVASASFGAAVRQVPLTGDLPALLGGFYRGVSAQPRPGLEISGWWPAKGRQRHEKAARGFVQPGHAARGANEAADPAPEAGVHGGRYEFTAQIDGPEHQKLARCRLRGVALGLVMPSRNSWVMSARKENCAGWPDAGAPPGASSSSRPLNSTAVPGLPAQPEQVGSTHPLHRRECCLGRQQHRSQPHHADTVRKIANAAARPTVAISAGPTPARMPLLRPQKLLGPGVSEMAMATGTNSSASMGRSLQGEA